MNKTSKEFFEWYQEAYEVHLSPSRYLQMASYLEGYADGLPNDKAEKFMTASRYLRDAGLFVDKISEADK